MTDKYGFCNRCGVEITDENWGVTLYDDGNGLDYCYDPEFCEGCRDAFVEWVESTPD